MAIYEVVPRTHVGDSQGYTGARVLRVQFLMSQIPSVGGLAGTKYLNTQSQFFVLSPEFRAVGLWIDPNPSVWARSE